MGRDHNTRKHSKLSASGAERWFNCSGSVALSEGLPDKSSPWAIEGTRAHEVLEKMIAAYLGKNWEHLKFEKHFTQEMVGYAEAARDFILRIWKSKPQSEILVETRIHLDFIDPEMFGTFDSAIVDHFGTLHVFDYKYGAGHAVSPKRNLQMIFYGLGLAAKYDWNFKRVRLWIIQPRIKGYDGPLFWEMSILDLKAYVPIFQEAVDQVRKYPDRYNEGEWCHWCKAKSICPLKQEAKNEKAVTLFSSKPIQKG